MSKKRSLEILLCVTMCIAQVILSVTAEDTASTAEVDGEAVDDTIVLSLADYSSGIVGGADTGTLSRADFDRKPTLKAVPNVYSEKPFLTIDGWNYAKAEIDFDKYGYMAIEYYYASDVPVGVAMNIGIMQRAFIDKAVYMHSINKLVPNMWAMAIFDFAEVKKHLVPDAENHNLVQMHIQPFGNEVLLKDMAQNDVMYIANLYFFTEKPDFSQRDGYMKGYNDGNFKPSGTMTRAEACTVIARILAAEEEISGECEFTDVAKDAWYYKYIAFCAEKGLLKSYSGEFTPSKPITRAEFAELVFLTSLVREKDADKAVSFSDVEENHPMYESIKAAAASGLIGGYADKTFRPDNTITRAEVVTVINRAMGTSKENGDIPSDIKLLFLDVDEKHWAFADIAEATVKHTEWNGDWMNVLSDPVDDLLAKVDKNLIFDFKAGSEKIAELDELEKKRVSEIRSTESVVETYGAKYYVSAEGNDKNNGRSPQYPLATIAAANKLAQTSDAVLLRRGDIFRERFTANFGVIYSAYGDGDKPKIYGSPENGADPAKWSLVYDDKETGSRIWKFHNDKMRDVGEIVFNEGEGYAYKDIPSSNRSQFIVRGSNDVQYDYRTGLSKDMMFFHGANTVVVSGVIDPAGSTGPLYLRCDNGNPGEIFDSIEFCENGHLVYAPKENTTIDNLCLMYGGAHGVRSNNTKNLKITNCEIAWIGGSVQLYGYGMKGGAVRYGNGIEVYGGCDGYTVENCYIHDVYDAGVTHQYSSGNNSYLMNDIKYKNNVITDCVMSIEYFVGAGTEEAPGGGTNYLIEGNLLRRAGYGFGSTRTDQSVQRHIRSGTSANKFTGYEIKSNIFDRSVYELTETCALEEKYLPSYSGGNVFVQGYKNRLFSYGGTTENSIFSGYVSYTSLENLLTKLKDDKTEFYYTDTIPEYEFSYKPSKMGSGTYAVVEDDMSLFEERPEEIIQPFFVRTARAMNLYQSMRDSMDTQYFTDEEAKIRYLHITPINTGSYMLFDTYGMNKPVPLGEGQVFIKVLLRSNKSTPVHLNLYSIKDKDDNLVSGASINKNGMTNTKGDGTWEEIIIPITGYNASYASSNHTQLFFLGNTAVGSSFFDEKGKLKEEVYCDVAAWGAFANEASARAISLADFAS